MKTAVTVLQEMMMKLGQTPDYECIAQTGPKHQAMFEYRCIACGVVVTASARSKKEAKQEVARLMLQQLSRRGQAVPPPYALPAAAMHADPVMMASAGAAADARSYVALLKELCEEYRLAAVSYELVGDTGPSHLRHFTVRARLGQHERVATATTKKCARQLAAEKLYSYLRENLARVTRDFNEEEALIRAHEKAMERFTDTRDEHVRRPDLGQMISEYHLGLTARIEESTRAAAVAALELADADAESGASSPCGALAAVAAALRISLEYEWLARDGGSPLAVVQLTGCAPELTFAGEGEAGAAAAALDYVRAALRRRPAPLPVPTHATTPDDSALRPDTVFQ